MRLLFLVFMLGFAGLAAAQDPPAAPPETPQAEPQQPSPNPQQQQQQREQEQRRREADEAARREMEAVRKRFADSLIPSDADTRLRTPTEACVRQSGPHYRGFDIQSIPLEDWLAGRDAAQIPWKIEVDDAALRMDQRYEIAYRARVSAKDVKGLRAGAELIFVSGVSGQDGQWLISPKVRRQMLSREVTPGATIYFAECVFLRPGEYTLWLAFYAPGAEQHNVVKRQVRVSESRSIPLKQLSGGLPSVEFPEVEYDGVTPVRALPGRLSLPVANKRQVAIEILPVVTSPEQWFDRGDILENHNNLVLAATSVLSQMSLEKGSISTSAIDLIQRETTFQQGDSRSLNWAGLAASFPKDGDNQLVSVLENRTQRPVFFRNWLEQRLRAPSESLRVFIVVASSMRFERGSNLTPVQVPADCNCRLYHVRLRHNSADAFDDLQKVLRPLRPRIFNIITGKDLREALGEIIEDLERL